MSRIKVVTANERGTIEISRETLEQWLNEAYSEGFHNGRYNYYNGHWYWTFANTADGTINSNDRITYTDSSITLLKGENNA